MTPALEVADLTVRFGRHEILRGLGFSVPAGQTVAILGPNGSGKSVLFKALIGAVPFAGTVTWASGTRIGYVPQKLDIERDLPITGRDFLRAKARVANCSDDAVRGAVGSVGIEDSLLSKPIGTLSGGQFQRLLLAFALVGSPNVLLCDEPTAGIDESGGERIYEMIHRLSEKERLTVLLISHELSLVYRYAEQVLCIGGGRAWFGAPSDVMTPERLEQIYGSPLRLHAHDDHAA